MSLDFSLHDAADNELFSANITHNLGRMADEAGIYEALWHPERIGATRASDIYGLLAGGLMKLASEPTRFKAFDSPNGWGLWRNFVPWLAEVTEACRLHPDARIKAWV